MMKAIQIKGELLTLEGGFAVLQVPREEWLKRAEMDEFAYALYDTDRKIENSGVLAKKVVIYERGYLIDGSERVILKALLSKREEPV